VIGNPGSETEQRKHDLSTALIGLCDKAYRLAITFRASKTKYEFEVHPEGTRLDAYSDAKMYEIRNGGGEISESIDPKRLQISRTLFGALVKTRYSETGEVSRVPLTPAQLIVEDAQRMG